MIGTGFLLAPLGAALLGYALGAIPFGVILTAAAGAGDLRKIGSGNIGATNVLRTGRKGLAAATLLLDLGKGWAAVALAELLWPGQAPVAAAAAFIGHCYPLWLRFKGGKGVATLMGIVLALHPPSALVYALLWLGLLAGLRISSAAGMVASRLNPGSNAQSVSAMYSSATKRSRGPQSPASHSPSVCSWGRILRSGTTNGSS